MSTEELEFAGDSIKVSGRSITTEHPIRNATLRGDKIIVLFEPDSVMGTKRLPKRQRAGSARQS